MRDEILYKVLTDQTLYTAFVKSVGIVECLNKNQKQLYKKITVFIDDNKRCLTEQEAVTLFEKKLDVGSLNTEFAFDMVLDEIRKEKLRFWILDVAEGIESNTIDYEKTYKELATMKEKLEVHIPKGKVIGEGQEEILDMESAKVKIDVLKTGITALDIALFGGCHKGELGFLIAPPGRGKSTFLINLVYGFLQQRKTVFVLSNELRTEAILSRLYRRIVGMNRSEFTSEHKVEVLKGLGNFFRYAKGHGIIHYVPVNSFSVGDIKSWVTAWENKLGLRADAVIIDYFDRLRKPYGDDNRLKLRALVDSLRDYAVEKDIFIGTATQSNRHGLNAPLVTEEHVGEAFSKIESADVVLSLSQDKKERDVGKARISVLKNREYGGVGQHIDVKTDWDRLAITDIGDNV